MVPNTTTTTTTALPTLVVGETSSLNVFERYPTHEAFLARFAPLALHTDRAVTAVCLPIGVLAVAITTAVLLTWRPPRTRRTKIYSNYTVESSLWRSHREHKWRSKEVALVRVLGGVICPLLLLRSVLLIILDLDGVWRLRILATVSAAALCPLAHALEVSIRVALPLLILLCVSLVPSSTASSITHRLCPSHQHSWCKRLCGLFSVRFSTFACIPSVYSILSFHITLAAFLMLEIDNCTAGLIHCGSCGNKLLEGDRYTGDGE